MVPAPAAWPVLTKVADLEQRVAAGLVLVQQQIFQLQVAVGNSLQAQGQGQSISSCAAGYRTGRRQLQQREQQPLPMPRPIRSTTHHPVAEVEAHNHLLEDPARLILRQPVVQAALAQEAVQLHRQAGGRAGGRAEQGGQGKEEDRKEPVGMRQSCRCWCWRMSRRRRLCQEMPLPCP